MSILMHLDLDDSSMEFNICERIYKCVVAAECCFGVVIIYFGFFFASSLSKLTFPHEGN